MKIYLVGGALRDKFLNIPVKDKDYVVVGSSPEEMISKGFKPIVKDFPVFLHPKTKEEYALARTEKKTGVGYHGFKFYSSPEVSLEEDLKRRDLTINAIAQDENGKIYDPYDGLTDIKKRILRHVSDAFIEDPLRVLRIARFSTLDKKFEIHKETSNLLKKMVLNNELKSLPKERIIEELKKGLASAYPSKMFSCLCDCGALNQIFPGINPDNENNLGFVELGNNLEKKLVKIAADFKLLLILLLPIFLNKTSNNENELTEQLKLSNIQSKVYRAVKSKKDNLDNFLDLSSEEKLECLNYFDFFRRPSILFEILNILFILNLTKDKLINLKQANNHESDYENFIQSRLKDLKNITQFLENFNDHLNNIKKTIDPAMKPDDIKKLIHTQRLNVLNKLKR